MKYLFSVMFFIPFLSCSKNKSAVELWQDNQGNGVPVTVTQKGDTTVYDFGVMVMSAETEVQENYYEVNPCKVNYGQKLGMDTLIGGSLWEEFTIRLGAYYGSASMRIYGLDETNWTYEYVGLRFEADSAETLWNMCDAERLFGH